MQDFASGPPIWGSACSSSWKSTGTDFPSPGKSGGFNPQQNLTIEEVEQLLELWKLQGPHGG
jgi:hypothetical protein